MIKIGAGARHIAISLAAAGLTATPLTEPSASAAVVESGKTVDDLTIYLGVVPAAIKRPHLREHVGEVSPTSARPARRSRRCGDLQQDQRAKAEWPRCDRTARRTPRRLVDTIEADDRERRPDLWRVHFDGGG